MLLLDLLQEKWSGVIESVCGGLRQMSKQKESKALELAVGSPLLCPLKGAEQTL